MHLYISLSRKSRICVSSCGRINVQDHVVYVAMLTDRAQKKEEEKEEEKEKRSLT